MRYNWALGVDQKRAKEAGLRKEARRAVVVVTISGGMGKSIRAEIISTLQRRFGFVYSTDIACRDQQTTSYAIG
jgi:hypothetical protein